MNRVLFKPVPLHFVRQCLSSSVCLSIHWSVQARSEGATNCKWLLVNIQDTQEFACQVLNRDVWNNPKVKDTVKANFIFWQVRVACPLTQCMLGTVR